MNIKEKIKKEIHETKVLLHNIPTLIVTLFVVSVICMNILANKTLIQLKWIALDGGILISWLSFLCMDLITKYFGLKASNKISILAALINLLTCLIFYISFRNICTNILEWLPLVNLAMYYLRFNWSILRVITRSNLFTIWL